MQRNCAIARHAVSVLSVTVVQVAAANFFCVVDGVLLTPKLGTILPGITRDAIITVARDAGLQVCRALCSATFKFAPPPHTLAILPRSRRPTLRSKMLLVPRRHFVLGLRSVLAT